jgi:2-C-methyl-D-erythritol 2,4-cyclodiphosphate synthase
LIVYKIMNKTGIGYDIHALKAGRALVLGGVEIPFDRGLDGHSDGDVILHAVCDALLGACGRGDIGELFPNTDVRYEGASSLKLLEQTAKVVHGEGFSVGNVDIVLIAEAPKIGPYKERIRANIATCLSISPKDVNVKATTNERLGTIGRGEGMAALATVMLVKGTKHKAQSTRFKN